MQATVPRLRTYSPHLQDVSVRPQAVLLSHGNGYAVTDSSYIMLSTRPDTTDDTDKNRVI